jgi:hypothetical protein
MIRTPSPRRALPALFLTTVLFLPAAAIATDTAGPRTVLLCHKPGSPAQKTLALPSPAASAHYGHGDIPGPCPQTRFLVARLSGFEEVPSVSTAASGRFGSRVAAEGDAVVYRLTYTGLQGEITQAHIHLGQRHVNGGVVAWLCANSAFVSDAPAGTPECSGTEGVVEGSIGSQSIVAVPGQGIDPGEFEEVLRAALAGATYVNVHTTSFPSGEIRGQIN